MPGLRYWDGTAWQPIAPSPAIGNLDPWHTVGAAGEPAFQSSWVNFGGSYATLAFRKDPFGKVLIRGTVKGGAPSTVLFTLPVGYRPPSSVIQTCWCSPITGSYVQIDNNGVVTAAGPAGITTSFDVSSVEFDTDTVTQYPVGPVGPQGPTPQAITLDTWHTVGAAGEPALQNGWVNTAGWAPLSFRKDPFGKVAIRGTISGGATGTIAFTLPVGYRPIYQSYYEDVLIDNFAAGGGAQVTPAGAVTFYKTGLAAAGTCYIGQIEFDTDSVAAMPQGPPGPAGPPGPTGVAPVASLDTWHIVGGSGEPGFQNSHTSYDAGATFTVPAFRKGPDGRVALRGNLKGGTTIAAGSVAFTLPSGYRPPKDMRFSGVESTTQSTATWQQVNVRADGTVFVMADANTINSLDGIEFDTDTVTQVTAVAANVQMDSVHVVGAAGEPAFQNSWANYDTPGALARNATFRKDPLGKVRLTGTIKTGATSTVAFTLPPAYRPPRDLAILINASGGTAVAAIYGAGAASPGAVQIANMAGANVSTFSQLDTIEFDTESVTQVAAGAAAQPIEPWHTIGAAGEPAYQNAWATYGGGPGAAFRKFPDGRVRLKGIIAGGTVNGTMFTLPVGYRPPGGLRFAVLANSAAAYGYVDPSGAVSIASGGSNAWCDLSVIEFDTESVANYTTAQIQVASPNRVTSLPVAPFDGQEIYFAADPTNGVMWHLRYNAASSSIYKWEFLGGAPLSAHVMTSEAVATTVVSNLTTDGPGVILPLAGDYDFSLEAMIGTTAVAGAYADALLVFGLAGGAFNALDASDFGRAMCSSASSGINADVICTRRRTVTTAGWTAKMQYRSGGTSVTFAGRRFTAEPVRVS